MYEIFFLCLYVNNIQYVYVHVFSYLFIFVFLQVYVLWRYALGNSADCALGF